jgi:hypothetical protein
MVSRASRAIRPNPVNHSPIHVLAKKFIAAQPSKPVDHLLAPETTGSSSLNRMPAIDLISNSVSLA